MEFSLEAPMGAKITGNERPPNKDLGYLEDVKFIDLMKLIPIKKPQII